MLFISSCSNDDETSTFESSKEENLMLHKNNSFLEKNEDVNFIINELSNIQKSNKNTQSSNQYDFIIHKENITYIKTLDGERESYTFFVEKEYKRNLNFVENLVISKKKNSDKFEAAIVTYFFPQGYNVENKNFQVLNSTPLDIDISHFSKSSIPLSKSSGGGCSYEVIETEHSCYSNEHFGAGESGKCDHKGYGPYSTYEVYLSCGSSGGGGGYNPSGPGSGSGGTETGPSGSGGNNGNGGANDGINTGITLPPSCQGMQCDDDAIINKINSILNNNHSASDYFIKNPQDLPILFTLGIDFFTQHPNISWEELKYLLHNKTSYESNLGDLDNNVIGGYDNTIYPTFDFQTQGWPNISPIISKNDFIGWGYPNIKRNCMDYAKAQIAIKGYAISNYSDSGQTFQIYTSNNGVNSTELSKGVSYLKYALTNNIPVIVGVDFKPGSPNPGTDNTTDHFVVIVGMGSDSNGMYLIFYDNAVNDPNGGANTNNKLYYNNTTKKFQGQSQSTYGVDKIYTITMIRKSKRM